MIEIGKLMSFTYKGNRKVTITVTAISSKQIIGILLTEYKGKNDTWEAGESKIFNINEMKNIKS